MRLSLPSLHLRHSSFSNLSVTSPTSQLILQLFRRFTYVTTDSPNTSGASPTSQLVVKPFLRFSYVSGSSLTSPGEPPMTLTDQERVFDFSSFEKPKKLLFAESSFSNLSLTSPTSQLIFQPFRCFTYFTAHFPTLLSILLSHRLFTYVTWRAAHDFN